MTVTSFDTVEEGAGLAVQLGGSSRWTYTDKMMVGGPANTAVDPWFFSGLLKQERVMLGDFRPPEVDEFWTRVQSVDRVFLVVETTEQQVTMACFALRRGEWIYYSHEVLTPGQVLDHYRRIESPPWATPVLLQMTRLMINQTAEVARLGTQMQALRQTRQDINYALSYLNSASERINRT